MTIERNIEYLSVVYNNNVVALVDDSVVVRVVGVTTAASQSVRSFDEHFACVTFESRILILDHYLQN